LKNILVVMTGGTIGSAARGGVIDVSEKAGGELIERFRKETGERDVQFHVIRPMEMLSENCTPAHWRTLITALDGAGMAQYDGVIVTHGSDTLSYTASLLGYLYGGLGVPIVITASGLPLDDPRSNGVRNFAAAVALIKNEGLPGVFAVYENSRGVMDVFLATRLMEADLYTGDFSGFGGGPFGVMEGGRLKVCAREGSPPLDALKAPRPQLRAPRAFESGVLAIAPYPGLDYTLFDLSRPDVKAVLHRLYHSSTACATPGRHALPEFIRRCRERGIEVFVQSVRGGRDMYVTAHEMLQAGAIALPMMSFEAAYVKLCLAVNQSELPVREFMLRPVYFEFVE